MAKISFTIFTTFLLCITIEPPNKIKYYYIIRYILQFSKNHCLEPNITKSKKLNDFLYPRISQKQKLNLYNSKSGL